VSLTEPLEMLDKNLIRAQLDQHSKSLLSDLVLLATTDSTNSWIRAQPRPEQPGLAVFAEYQSAGRGRRGQRWVSPSGRNIYLSIGWKFESGAAELGCLPLVLALGACDALEQAGLRGHGVKWPNDLWLDHKKLGGCLVEIQGDTGGPCAAVMGVGINVCMPTSTPETGDIDQAWTDVASRVPDISRNLLAAKLLNSIIRGLDQFTQHGFEPFTDEWKSRDLLSGEHVELKQADKSISGQCLGISRGGGLLIQGPQAVGEYMSGEVSNVKKESSA